jgi:SAM-dependent methyltransferase
MSLPRHLRTLKPVLTTSWRAYSSLNRSIPFNFFAGYTVANMTSTTFPATPYAPTYDNWPYTASDFARYDENDDGVFYQLPRLVTHIDGPSIARLTQYYDTVLPQTGSIMDMCTSWKSFYPASTKSAIQTGDLSVYGVGLNAEEMALNGVFRGPDHWRVIDLNKPPHDIRSAWENSQDLQFDATTCVVSIDYLTNPLQVCKKLLEATKEGGKVHLVVSNRCFPNKVVGRWMMLDERSRLEFVGDYLHFAGWRDVQIVDLCARDERGMRVTDDRGTVLRRSSRLPDHLDPLWVVRGTKSG